MTCRAIEPTRGSDSMLPVRLAAYPRHRFHPSKRKNCPNKPESYHNSRRCDNCRVLTAKAPQRPAVGCGADGPITSWQTQTARGTELA